MLQPKQTKFRKMHKGRNRGLAQSGNTIAFGEYALKATTRGRITARQIESARRAMTRSIKRGGNIWIRIFPDKPITKKPLEVRMGKGKGNVEYWVSLFSQELFYMKWLVYQKRLQEKLSNLLQLSYQLEQHLLRRHYKNGKVNK